MVCVVIGLLALVALPRVRIDNSQVDTAARTIGMSLMVAQREAVARQHNVLVMFDTAHHSVRTVWDVNNNGVVDAGEKSRPFLLPERVMLGRPSDVPKLGGETESSGPDKSTSNGPYYIMQRSGSTDRSTVIYLTTKSSLSGGNYRDVRALFISRATGRPVWYKWKGSAWGRG